MFFWSFILLIATLVVLECNAIPVELAWFCVIVSLITSLLCLWHNVNLTLRIRRIKWKRGYAFGSAFTHLGGMSQVAGREVLLFLSPERQFVFRDRQSEVLIPYDQVQKILILKGRDVMQVSDAYICQVLQVEKKLALYGLREKLKRQRHVANHDIIMLVVASHDHLMSDVGELVVLAHDRASFKLRDFKRDNELMPKIRYMRLDQDRKK